MKKAILIVITCLALLYGLLSLPGWLGIFSLNQSISIDWSILLHPVLLAQLGLFVLAHFLIFSAVLLLCLLPSLALSQGNSVRLVWLSIACFILLSYALIGYASVYYPWLEIALISDSMSNGGAYKIIGIVAASCLVVICCVSLFIQQRYELVAIQLLLMLFFCWPLFSTFSATTILTPESRNVLVEKSTQYAHPQSAPPNQPNIILVGLDSVSLYQAQQHKEQMPFLSQLLNNGYQYTDAFTPLARTFGAWNSILSGRYPASSGVRFNLSEFNPDHIIDSLPWDLKALGYTNIFAQDERRFSNINEEYGFDYTVGPSVGAVDFILPLFADHLFSAYFTNTQFGAWLLPSLYINRVSSVTYAPEYFVQRILSTTASVRTNSPLFFASHFCIAHFPYRWRTYRNSEINSTDELVLYRDSLNALDQQLQQLFWGLEQQGRLHNAIVILLSDHGEGLGKEPPLWLNDHTPAADFGLILRGHGNSLLARDQTNVILNIQHLHSGTRLNLWTGSEPDSEHNKINSNTNNSAHIISTPVSLVDIRPTVLTLLNAIPTHNNIDGVPLPPATTFVPTHRYLFMETGMMMNLPRPNADASELVQSVKDKMRGYQINARGRLTVTNEFIKTSINDKQYAAINNEYLLLSRPTGADDYLLVNRANNTWQRGSEEYFKQGHFRDLMLQLRCYIDANSACYGSLP